MPKFNRNSIYRVYYLLASIDLVTIILTLGIAFGVHTIYDESFKKNKVWMNRIDQYEEVTKLIIQANGPGNTVFESKKIQLERENFISISNQMKNIFKEIEIDSKNLAENYPQIITDLKTVSHSLEKAEKATLKIFENLSEGNQDTAAEQMARMDNFFHDAMIKMLEIKSNLRSYQRSMLEQNHDEAYRLFKKEIYVAFVVLGIVFLVLYFGKKLKESLQKNEEAIIEKSKQLLTYEEGLNQHSIVAKTDKNGKINYVNDLFLEISGYSREELLGQDHRILNSGHHPKSFFENMWRTINSGRKWSGEIRNQRKDGTHYWVQASIIPVKNQKDEIDEFLSIRTDISQIKELERISREVQNIAKVGAWQLKFPSEACVWTEETFRIHGTPQIENMNLKDFVHHYPNQEQEKLLSAIELSKAKAASFEIEIEFKHQDGSSRYFNIHGVPDVSNNGEVTQITGSIQDITEKRNAEKLKLKELNDILTSTPSCLKIITRDGLLIDMNHQGLSLIEADGLESVYKANVYDIVEPNHREKFKQFNEKVCDGEKGTLIFEIIGLKGTKRWMETYAAPYKLSNGESAHIAITNDISEKIQAEKEQIKQQQIALHQSKLASIGELAAGVGHEINNPLAIVKGHIGSLEKKLKKAKLTEEEKILSSLTKIDIATDRIAKIVQGLRNFSRADSEELTTFSALEAIEESISLISEIYQKEGITLGFEASQKENNLLILGNRGKFQQIFMNIISNAKDATEDISKRKITLCYKEDKDHAEISVSDNGKGIPKEIQEKIFDPFFTTKEINKGTGIGLSLVFNFVKEMNGKISLESTVGQGSTFKLIFPISNQEKESAA